MIKSMTAFAREQKTLSQGEIVWEIRSVNHRYLETYFKLPEEFRASESKLRQHLLQKLKRGKVECFLRFNKSNEQAQIININSKQADLVIDACHKINDILHQPSEINPIEILQWQGVLEPQSIEMDAVIEASEQAFICALDDLQKNRAREGARLKTLVMSRCEAIETIVLATQKNMPEIVQRYNEKIQAKLDALSIEVNQDRVEQELLYLLQKIDVAEELDRLTSHLQEIKNVLNSEGAIGRRLDFLMQELNREANTLGSKSVDLSSTNASVDLKVLIEQMREQIQNIE